ncbi:MAG TPA: NADH-quinone oxidoreductase subunit L [Polyangiaceae bacterium]
MFPQDDFSLFGIILGMPLLGALINGVWGKRLGKPAVRVMAVAAVTISFVCSVIVLFSLNHFVDASSHVEGGKTVHEHVRLTWTLWQWMHTNGGLDPRVGPTNVPIDVRFSVDALSSVMMLIITGIGALIHLYATSYMADDASFHRFFAYLNLFVFAMLVLVMADNLPILFIGWEGVGLCSYLLIGFWYQSDANAAAGKKAFIANRIGDFGLLCAMFILAQYCGALDWNGIESNVTHLVDPPVDALRIHLWPLGGGKYEGWASILQPATPVTISAATACGLALLLGCTGKSAQIPLYTWLPDAMAGPTPVSALIHAATMVTAGVYLICRLHFVFLLSPFVMMVIALVGAFTALYAASIALVQYDIKKVLAYSTVSQLGYMFLGVGVGAFSAGFFHVLTHAFFKACLFLCAGSVIHAMHGRVHDSDASQDMRNMGGLRKYMPYTYWTFAVSTAAIVGFPFLSGFFSKDEIMYRAYVDHLQSPLFDRLKHEGSTPFTPPAWIGTLLFAVAVTAAVMTAFYMCRAFFMTFWGDFRGWKIGRPSMLAKMEASEHEGEHRDDLTTPGYPPHESPWQMTVPLIVLATGAAVAGILDMGLFHVTPIDHWLEPVFETATKASVNEHGRAASAASLLPFGLGAFALGSYAAYHLYVTRKGADEPQYIAAATRLAQAMTGILLIAIGAILWAVVPWTPGAWPRIIVCGGLAVGGVWAILRYVWIGLDRLYDETAVSLVDALADTSAQFDQWVIDGILAKVTAFVVAASGTVLRALQNGVVHLYAAMMVVGVAAIGWFFVVPHASANVVAKGTDFVVSTGTAGGYLGYEYEWTQCEPDKHLWQKGWDDTMKIDDAKKRTDEQHHVIDDLKAKHGKCEAPGDKWVAVSKDFSPTSEVTLHLEPDSDPIVEETRPVRLRAKNVFSPALGGYAASTVVYVPRGAKVTVMEVGQNQ